MDISRTATLPLDPAAASTTAGPAAAGAAKATVPPDAAPCWAGDWDRVDVRTQVWGQAAVLRTVGALPKTHPWRLGGQAGSVRQVQWTGRPATLPDSVLCVLSVTARDPKLDAGVTTDIGEAFTLDDLSAGLGLGEAPRWAGAIVRLPDVWLPSVALLPRGIPGLPAPRTAWETESVEFEERYVVQGEIARVSADLLSPSVMAVLLDAVPRGSAVCLAGDALQIWWPYDESAQRDMGRLQRAATAALLLVKTFPSFVLRDFPDRSAEVEASYARKAQEAQDYRDHRRFGTSSDPVLQRIYDQARSRGGTCS
jgi:hypothetical protein